MLPSTLPIIFGLVAFGVGMFWMSLLVVQTRHARKSVLLHQLELYAKAPREIAPTTKLPSPVRAFISTAAELLVPATRREQLHEQLAKAGKHNFVDITDMADRKVLYGFIGLGLSLLLGASGSQWAILGAPLLVAAGFYLPEVLIYNEAIKRTQDIEYALADSVDLLSMCVESGLGLEAAFGKVSDTQKGPMSEEFAAVLAELRMGKSRNEAFDDMASRNSQPDLLRFISAMKQVDKLGIPVAAVLQEQSHEMRAARRERAREQAQKVPVKILMPVMLCFLPGIFLIILGPAVISIMTSSMFG